LSVLANGKAIVALVANLAAFQQAVEEKREKRRATGNG
tara:strand:+ start:215 stop:328 length:114 start_codon:yes stop_codon:yes gene_type:complete